MIIESIIGNIRDFDLKKRRIDFISLEWYETNKRIMKKKSVDGEEIGIKLGKDTTLKDGDILWADDGRIIVVEVCECDAISMYPKDMVSMGKICYEIGNKHIPLFLSDTEIVTPFDQPLFDLLEKNRFEPRRTRRKLENLLECKNHGH